MGISPYLAGLRKQIGTELLLVPTVAVLPRDEDGRVLLVRLSDTGQWATIGGAIDPHEAPEDAARREAFEEANIEVRLLRLVVALGGPEYQITYPNGDLTSCVPIVYEAEVIAGPPAPDNDETIEVGWFHPTDFGSVDLTPVNRHLLNSAFAILER